MTLNSDLTPAEIMDSVKSLQSGKSPSLDGLGIEFYKKFANQITPLLHRLYSHSVASKKLLPTLYEANVVLLLKQDRDETDPSPYWPFAMLNSDFKILS